jgi:hypothetical protein
MFSPDETLIILAVFRCISYRVDRPCVHVYVYHRRRLWNWLNSGTSTARPQRTKHSCSTGGNTVWDGLEYLIWTEGRLRSVSNWLRVCRRLKGGRGYPLMRPLVCLAHNQNLS